MSGKHRNQRGKSVHLQKIHGSQNFLTSRRLLERIVRRSTIDKKDIVMDKGAAKRFFGVPIETKFGGNRAFFLVRLFVNQGASAGEKHRTKVVKYILYIKTKL